MRGGYSVKEQTKQDWKMFYLKKKLRKMFWKDLTFWQKISFIFGGTQ